MTSIGSASGCHALLDIVRLGLIGVFKDRDRLPGKRSNEVVAWSDFRKPGLEGDRPDGPHLSMWWNLGSRRSWSSADWPRVDMGVVRLGWPLV